MQSTTKSFCSVAGEVGAWLEDQEMEILRVVRLAYEAHARHETALPYSTFLRFPADDRNRVIALPAYLGNSFNIAGIKWISSFPNNQYWTAHEPSVGRNHTELTETGRPEAIIEGSIISAKRTAASAALAAQQGTWQWQQNASWFDWNRSYQFRGTAFSVGGPAGVNELRHLRS